jgi:glycosyltransferase involved in cell wall biosynthesis
MKMLGLMRVKNEDRWLTMCLEAQYFLDHIIVLDDNSTDSTEEICRHFGVEYYKKPYDKGWDEGRDREVLANMAIAYNPDWVCSMDGDEVLLPDTWDKLKPVLDDPTCRVIDVLNINLWNNANTVRTDAPWGNQYRQRFWRFKPGVLTYSFDHCSIPNEITERPFTQCGLGLLHYGYMLEQDRVQKYARYVATGNDWPSIIQKEGVTLTSLADICARL